MHVFTAGDSYAGHVVPDTVWANQCERFFRQSGKITSPGECSSGRFQRMQEGVRGVYSSTPYVAHNQILMDSENSKVYRPSVGRRFSSKSVYSGSGHFGDEAPHQSPYMDMFTLGIPMLPTLCPILYGPISVTVFFKSLGALPVQVNVLLGVIKGSKKVIVSVTKWLKMVQL